MDDGFVILVLEGGTHEHVGDEHIISAEPPRQVAEDEDGFRILWDPLRHDHQE